MRGKFLVVEGLEGAGKSTVIHKITQFFNHRGIEYVNTREPGGTPMAEAIRECVKQQWEEQVTKQTELLLMYAARSQLVENVIKPALSKGLWVIGDRHDLSTVAYQGGGREISLAELTQLRQLTLGNFMPDYTIYLDIDPLVGLQRAKGRGELDRIELSGVAFFERAREMYLSQLSNMPDSATIDANQPIDKVHEDTIKALTQWAGVR